MKFIVIRKISIKQIDKTALIHVKYNHGNGFSISTKWQFFGDVQTGSTNAFVIYITDICHNFTRRNTEAYFF